MSEVRRVKLSEIIQDVRNANRHTERGEYMIRRSIEKFKFAEAGTLDANNRIVGGNKRTEVAADVLDAEEAIIIDVDGDVPVFIRRRDIDLSTPEGRELAVALNRTAQISIDFEPLTLTEFFAEGAELGDWFTPEEFPPLEWDYDVLPGNVAGDNANAGNGQSGGALVDLPLPDGVPDALWPSDNKFGIPLLSLERQGDTLELPIEIWGAKRRGTKAGTLLFYTDDYRFRAIWENPQAVAQVGATAFVEPNFSVYKNFPLALALWRTYQKRWLARYWQSLGIRCFVDLNVNPDYYDVNLLGVPKGWRAWATRGYAERLDMTGRELQMAREHAGTDDILFAVYGGGKAVKEWCETNGTIWISEDADRAKGLYTEAIYG